MCWKTSSILKRAKQKLFHLNLSSHQKRISRETAEVLGCKEIFLYTEIFGWSAWPWLLQQLNLPCWWCEVRESCGPPALSLGHVQIAMWFFLAKRNASQKRVSLPLGLKKRGAKGMLLPFYFLILLHPYHLVSIDKCSWAPANTPSNAFPCGSFFLGLGANKLASVSLSPHCCCF